MIIDQQVPNVRCRTTQGDMDLHTMVGDNWCLLVAHPLAFTPICTTDLAQVTKLMPELQRRNVKPVALTTNTCEENQLWSKDILNLANMDKQTTQLPFPIICDHDRSVAVKLDMLQNKDDPVTSVRACMIISPDKRLKGLIWAHDSIGRNYEEVLRVIDALQLCQRFNFKIGTPANWKVGEKVAVLPTATKEEITRMFPKGVDVVQVPSGRDYMKMMPAPTQTNV